MYLDEIEPYGVLLQGVGAVVLAIGICVAGIWALINSRQAKAAESTRWLRIFFDYFYHSESFKQVRRTFLYDYRTRIGPLLEKRLHDRDLELSAEEEELLDDLDSLFNMVEFVLYLEHCGEIKTNDSKALLNYWMTLFDDPEKGAVRTYCARFDFEMLERRLRADARPGIFVYGSLRKGLELVEPVPEGIHAERKKWNYVPNVETDGTLVQLGSYPGLIVEQFAVTDAATPARVLGELVEPEEGEHAFGELLHLLDEYEGFDRQDPSRSQYLRTLRRVYVKTSSKVEERRDAWMYVYNGEVRATQHIIPGGDWSQALRGSKRIQ